MPVKADAYGHGAVEISKTALESGCSYLAVATVDEGALLREAGIQSPILLLSEALPDELEMAVSYRLVPFISDIGYAELFSRAAEKAGRDLPFNVFLKIDTGMGRLGCAPADALLLARFIAAQKSLKQLGTATHFAVSDSESPEHMKFTRTQIALFNETIQQIQKAGLNPGIVSAANSGATVSYKDALFDLVRPGILLYGYQDARIKPPLDVKPVMELVSKIVYIKKLKSGESVSYGKTWTARNDTFIGILPAGYADGLPRLLSGKNFHVVINGEEYPLVGRICMDQCMIDLGPCPRVKRYDEVTLFGGKKPSCGADDIANLTGTISYEISCNINKRVPRLYVRKCDESD
jgi:alanine racemase